MPLPVPRSGRRGFFLAMIAVTFVATAFIDASPALAVSAEDVFGGNQIGAQIQQKLAKIKAVEQIEGGLDLVEMSSCWTCDIFIQIYDLKEKFAAQLKFPIQDKILPLLRSGLVAYVLFIGLQMILPGDTSALWMAGRNHSRYC